jgi:hypothetical protein
MTLQQPANTNADTFGIGIGGSFFNLIDVVQPYVFDPTELKIRSITRLANGHVVLQCQGVPNQPNTIQSSLDLTSGFSFLDTVMADANGMFEYEDASSAGLTKKFYRLTLP